MVPEWWFTVVMVVMVSVVLRMLSKWLSSLARAVAEASWARLELELNLAPWLSAQILVA
jgi:hypothetical protein